MAKGGEEVNKAAILTGSDWDLMADLTSRYGGS